MSCRPSLSDFARPSHRPSPAEQAILAACSRESVFEQSDAAYPNAQLVTRLCFNSPKMAADLARFGVVSNKTDCCKVLLLEDDPALWRGLVCGDGWVSDPPSLAVGPEVGLTATWEVCEQFLAFAKRRVDCNPGIHPNGSIWKTRITGYAATRLLTILFPPGCMALPRKLAKARECIEKYGPKHLS